MLKDLIAMADRQMRNEDIARQRQLIIQAGGQPPRVLTKQQQKRRGVLPPFHPPPQLQLQSSVQWPTQYSTGGQDGGSSMQLGTDGEDSAGSSGGGFVKSELWGVSGAGGGGEHRWNQPSNDSLPWNNYDEKTGVPLITDVPTELPAFTGALAFDTPQWRASHPRPDHVVAVHRLSVRHPNNGGVITNVGLVQWMAHKVASRANRLASANNSSKQQCFEMLAMDYSRSLWNIMSPIYKLQRLPEHAVRLKFEETSFMGFTLANEAMWDASIDQLYDRVLKNLANFYTIFTDTIFRCSGGTTVGAGDFATAVTNSVNLRLSNHGEADDADERQLVHLGSQRRQQQLLLEFSSPPSSSIPIPTPSFASPPQSSSPSSPSSLSLSLSYPPSSPSYSSSSLQQLSSPPPPPAAVVLASSPSALTYPTPAYVPPSSPWSVATISSPMSPQSPMSPLSPSGF